MNNTITAVVLLLVIGVVLTSSWRTKTSVINNKECIILNEKKLEGILFGGCFDIWHISHFLLWVLIGLLSPYHYWIAFGLSVGWESYEHIKFNWTKR